MNISLFAPSGTTFSSLCCSLSVSVLCVILQYDTDLQVGSVPKPTAGCAVISSSETSSSCSPSSSSSSPTARLRLVTFEGSDLRDCNLSGCELAGAVFRDACCDGAVMSGAKLHGADFTGADTAGLCLDNVRCRPFLFYAVVCSCFRVSFMYL